MRRRREVMARSCAKSPVHPGVRTRADGRILISDPNRRGDPDARASQTIDLPPTAFADAIPRMARRRRAGVAGRRARGRDGVPREPATLEPRDDLASRAVPAKFLPTRGDARWVRPGLAATIDAPRLYTHERLPQ